MPPSFCSINQIFSLLEIVMSHNLHRAPHVIFKVIFP